MIGAGRTKITIKRPLYLRVYISLPGLVERLQAGVEKEHCPMKVRAAPERHLSSWIGGSIWAKLGQNKNSWTTKEEYDEFGPSVVHSKCI